MITEANGHTRAKRQAIEIAESTLRGEYDLLLACRRITHMRSSLPNVSKEILNVFAGVDSEIDDLPLGDERELWAPTALEVQDKRASKYRKNVKGVVEEALMQLLSALAQRD